MTQQPGAPVDVAAANRHGQQLFFANMHSRNDRPRTHRGTTKPPPPAGYNGRVKNRRLTNLSRIPTTKHFNAVPWRQLVLFDLGTDPAALAALAATVDHDLLRYCDEVARDHARLHGWSTKQINDVRRGLRLVHALQDTPGAKVTATDVLKLPGLQGNLSAQSTLDVLAAAGLLEDDRLSPVERYFIHQTEGLPEPMITQLRTWFDIMVDGSDKPPRRQPRDPRTANWQIRAIAPILRVWASAGHDSLAEIDRDDVLAALPPNGAARHLADQGLRSLFGVLRSRKLVFANPTRQVPPTPSNQTIPLPLDTEVIRQGLDSPDPATALAVALVAFHALTARQVRAVELTHIVDARLTLDGRVIPLAGPVLPRLSAWLDHRSRTWPATANPYLFVNRRTAPRLTQVSRPFPWRGTALTPRGLREDRILDEVRATGGDVRQICELFAITVETALRYLGPTDDPPVPPTHRSS